MRKLLLFISFLLTILCSSCNNNINLSDNLPVNIQENIEIADKFLYTSGLPLIEIKNIKNLCDSYILKLEKSKTTEDMSDNMNTLMWYYEFYVSQYCYENFEKIKVEFYHSSVQLLVNIFNDAVVLNIYKGSKNEYANEANGFTSKLSELGQELKQMQKYNASQYEINQIKNEISQLQVQSNKLKLLWENRTKYDESYEQLVKEIRKNI